MRTMEATVNTSMKMRRRVMKMDRGGRRRLSMRILVIRIEPGREQGYCMHVSHHVVGLAKAKSMVINMYWSISSSPIRESLLTRCLL